MTNSLRTLLLNIDGSLRPGFDFFGEEFVPSDYRATILPGAIRRVHETLFNHVPDRAFLNYRLRQLLAIVANSRLADYASYYDSRITYIPGESAELFNLVEQLNPVPIGNTDATLFIQGQLGPPDANGRLKYVWQLDVLGMNIFGASGLSANGTVRVRAEEPIGTTEELDIVFTDQLSEPIPLQGSDFNIRLNHSAEVGDQWELIYYSRPTRDIGGLVAEIEALGEPTLLELFGAAPTQPIATFKSYWQTSRYFADRLAAVVLALASRTEERRLLEAT